MLYSIIPPEIVFDDWDGKELKTYQEIMYRGKKIIVEPLEENRVKVIRLLSTTPEDFLSPELYPGNIIEFVPAK